MNILAPASALGAGMVCAELLDFRLVPISADRNACAVGDVTVTRENGLRLGFVRAQAGDVAGALVLHSVL